jgi:beta-galactosidase
MEKKSYFIIAVLSLNLLASGLFYQVSFSGINNHKSKKVNPDIPTARRIFLLDPNWKFHLGDADSPEGDFGFGLNELFAKAGETSGPAMPDFNDSAWRTVNLPHDWAVELNFVNVKDRTLNSHGYKPLGRQFPKTSIGWYRKSFVIPESDKGKQFSVKFDGVFRDCMVWINGFYLGNNFSGYIGFKYNITDYLNYGGKNSLVVRVNATETEGWFYEGAGIYRHVWLLEYAPLHIPLYGTYITTGVSEDSTVVNISTKIFNESPDSSDCTLYSILENSAGEEVAEVSTSLSNLKGYHKKEVHQKIKIAGPHLWSIDDPYLYRLVQVIKKGDEFTERKETNVGIRTVTFDKDNGFSLNGKRVELKGTCNHQDHAGVGTALPDGLQYFRIRKLKEMGSNAYRTSHYPPTPELLDACDKLGMLVMDENRYFGTTPEITSQFKRQIMRDRNHPSVILWSIGNEEMKIQNTKTGIEVAQSLLRIQRELDPSRTSTYAANNGGTFGGINSIIPIRGFNYYFQSADKYRQEHPDQILLGTEQGATFCARGVYKNDSTRGHLNDYDINKPDGWGATAEEWWKFFDARKWLAGGFVWTGFDYRGEPDPFEWPCINSHFGIMDICGFAKNNFYYYQSWWSDKDVLHIFPHWNWKGKEDQLIDVWCYSNCDSVALFLNGKSLGIKTIEKNSHLEWKVAYVPGMIEARGWKNGEELSAKVETTGKPVAVKLKADRSSINADGEDVSVITATVVDSGGREVPLADNLVHFEVHGVGEIIGVGNGDPSSHEKDKYLNGNYQRKLFNGKCEVIILSSRKPGEIILKADSEGLKSNSIIIKTVNSKKIEVL